MATVNVPVFSQVSIAPAQITQGKPFVLSVVVTESPVPVYPVSNYSNEIYSQEVKPAWP